MPSTDVDHQLPPHDVGAEQAVISALLLDQSAIYRVGHLQPSDFFREENAWYFAAAQALHARNAEITVTTLAHELEREGRAASLPYLETDLTELASSYFTAVGVEAHAAIVARDSAYRRAITLAGQIARDAYAGGPSLDDTLSSWRSALDNLQAGSGRYGAIASKEIVARLLEQGVDPGKRRGVTCGWETLDAYLQGFVPGEVVTVGAHTSVGKTAFTVGMVQRMASKGVRVGYIPVEGNADTLTARMAASLATFSIRHVRERGSWPAIDGESGERIYKSALRGVGELPIFWPDRHLHEISDIASWGAVRAHQDGVQVLVIDHIDVCSANGRWNGRQAEIAYVMRTLEQLARRESLVVVSLSQVRRRSQQERAKQPHPRASDLREAGDKEELSQVVLMLHQDTDQSIHVKVDKCTEGPTGTVYCVDNPETRTPAFRLFKDSGAIYELVRGEWT